MASVIISSCLAGCSLLFAGGEMSSGGGSSSPRVDGDERTEPQDDADSKDGDVPDAPKTDSATGPTTIVVPHVFTTPNGAKFTTASGGTTITGFTSPNTRAVILPSPQPAISAEDYTVEAVVRAPTNALFGLLARVQPGGGASAAFGPMPESGGAPIAFPHLRAHASFNGGISAQNIGTGYGFTANARYRMTLTVTGKQATAKIWRDGQADPGFQTVSSMPWSTGREIGFFVADRYDVVLESLSVTVP